MKILIPSMYGYGIVAVNFWLNTFFGFYIGSPPNLTIAIGCLFILLPYKSFKDLKIQGHNPLTWNGKTGPNSNEYMKEYKMLPIIIDDNVKADINRLMKIAENNIVDIYKLNQSGELKEGDINPIGDDSNHVIEIPMGFKVVYSIENQGEGSSADGKILLGKCKHLSMSIMLHDRIPAIEAVEMVAHLFGFSPLYNCAVWPEDAGGTGKIAINVLEPIDGFPDNLKDDARKGFVKLMKYLGYTEDIIKLIDAMRTKETV